MDTYAHSVVNPKKGGITAKFTTDISVSDT